MNTKKIILAVAGGVVVLALLITGIFVAGKKIGGKKPANDNSSLSSQTGSGSSGSGSSDGNSSDATVSAGKVELPKVEAKTGKKVSVPIKLSKNPGINAAQLIFEYDSSALTYNGCENGDILDECEDAENSGVITVLVQNGGIEDSSKNGTLITLSFTVKDGAKPGTYTVKASEKSMICNSDEVIVVPELSDGQITVK